MGASTEVEPSSDSETSAKPGLCKKPSKVQIIRGTTVALGLISSGVGSAFTDFDTMFRPTFQPAAIAFGPIWGLIYLMIAVMTVRLFFMESFPRINIIIGFLTAGLVGSCVWSATVNPLPFWQSPILYFCWLCAVISTGLIKANLRTLDGWLMSMGPSLFAGWLSLASGLGLAIAGHDKGEYIGPWALLPTGVIAAVVSIYSGTPGTSIPLLWATIWSHWTSEFYSTYVVLVVGILTLCCSLARGFTYKNSSEKILEPL